MRKHKTALRFRIYVLVDGRLVTPMQETPPHRGSYMEPVFSDHETMDAALAEIDAQADDYGPDLIIMQVAVQVMP